MRKISIGFLMSLFGCGFYLHFSNTSVLNKAQAAVTFRRVNIPFGANNAPYPSHSIFWFGKVDLLNNYNDVRILYSEDWLMFTIHAIDRLLWIDNTPSAGEVKSWDSVSLYINTNGVSGTTPQSTSYRIDLQLGDFNQVYKGNGSSWIPISIPKEAFTSWRGENGPNSNGNAKGWQADIYFPFTSLGFSEAPPFETIWGLAVSAQDRDDAAGTNILIKTWPETMDPNQPATWGEMSFGWKKNHIPIALTTGSATIQHGFNNVTVKDGEVGGHTICGDNVDHWTQWGNTNYSGYNQINIQNQWDVSDWPCFSKFFVTFPLNSIPANKTIISAKLSMTLFGNAGGGVWGEPPDSFIQVLTVGEDWNESTLTWNNAPLAKENIAGVWVKPRNYNLPYETYSWEIRDAFVDAYASGQPLRLALYSADGERHTGKYFWSSDSNEWNGTIRPKLEIFWGSLCDAPQIVCHLQFLPITKK